MIEAELRGRTADEDHFVSCVFGLLNYMPFGAALGPWLDLARNNRGESIIAYWARHDIRIADNAMADWLFWPSFEASGSPDVLGRLRDERGRRLTLVVEAKLGSGQSRATQPADYLAALWRERLDGRDPVAKQDGDVVLYATDDLLEPEADVAENVRALEGDSDRLFWVSWSHLWTRLPAGVAGPIADLRRFLEHHGQTRFTGLRAEPTRPARFWNTGEPAMNASDLGTNIAAIFSNLGGVYDQAHKLVQDVVAHSSIKSIKLQLVDKNIFKNELNYNWGSGIDWAVRWLSVPYRAAKAQEPDLARPFAMVALGPVFAGGGVTVEQPVFVCAIQLTDSEPTKSSCNQAWGQPLLHALESGRPFLRRTTDGIMSGKEGLVCFAWPLAAIGSVADADQRILAPMHAICTGREPGELLRESIIPAWLCVP